MRICECVAQVLSIKYSIRHERPLQAIPKTTAGCSLFAFTALWLGGSIRRNATRGAWWTHAPNMNISYCTCSLNLCNFLHNTVKTLTRIRVTNVQLAKPLHETSHLRHKAAVRQDDMWLQAAALNPPPAPPNTPKPSRGSPYRVALEGLDRSVLTQLAHMDAHVCAAGGKCIVALPVHVQSRRCGREGKLRAAMNRLQILFYLLFWFTPIFTKIRFTGENLAWLAIFVLLKAEQTTHKYIIKVHTCTSIMIYNIYKNIHRTRVFSVVSTAIFKKVQTVACIWDCQVRFLKTFKWWLHHHLPEWKGNCCFASPVWASQIIVVWEPNTHTTMIKDQYWEINMQMKISVYHYNVTHFLLCVCARARCARGQHSPCRRQHWE